MQYRRLGNTGLNVSVIGFGAFPIGYLSLNESLETLSKAADKGVNFIHTAPSYKNSQKKISLFLKSRQDDFYIATNAGDKTYRSAEDAENDIDRSLSRLNLKKLDLYMIHSYTNAIGAGKALEGIKKAKHEGKIDHIGFAHHWNLSEMKKAILSNEFETIMISYSPIDQEGVSKEIIPLAKERGLGIIVMKPLLEGDLTTPGSSGGRIGSLHGLRGRNPMKNDPLVEKSLRYTLSVPGISTVIPGMANILEVEECTRVCNSPLEMDSDERKELFGLIGGLGRRFNPFGQICLNCGYCEPCPEGIEIPEVYRAWMMCGVYPPYFMPIRKMGLDLFQSLKVSPQACTDCRICETKCPANLPVAQQMREIGKRMMKSLSVKDPKARAKALEEQ